jgi:MFS family permease
VDQLADLQIDRQAGQQTDADMEQRVIGRLLRHLLPLLIICYFCAILDRSNVGVAALTMNHDLGLTAAAFGFGAGVFFVPYFLFEVPSNLALQHFGARRWIARILMPWGVLAAATAFVWNANSFFTVRALLGVAEAGFFPGIIFYLMFWVPTAQRGRFTAYFMISIPVSALIGTPIGGLILHTDGFLGLHGWRWLFIVEGVPAFLLGFVVLFVLPDRPAQAKWLPEAEQTWLLGHLDEAQRVLDKAEGSKTSAVSALRSPRVLLLALAYTGLVGLNAGLGVFIPLIMKMFKLDNFQTTLVASLPFLAGAIGIVGFGWLSDR